MIGQISGTKRVVESFPGTPIQTSASNEVSQVFKKARESQILLNEDHLGDLAKVIDKKETEWNLDDLILLVRACREKSIQPFFLKAGDKHHVNEKSLEFPFSIGIRHVKEGTLLLVEIKELGVDLEGSSWRSAFEVLIPSQMRAEESLPVRKVQIAYPRNLDDFNQEQATLSRVFAHLPSSKDLFRSPSLAYSQKPALLRKEDARTLSLEEKREIFPLDAIQICEDITKQLMCLHAVGVVNDSVKDQFISLSKKGNEPIQAFLDNTLGIDLSQSSSFEKDQNDLILLVSDFFLLQKMSQDAFIQNREAQIAEWRDHLLKEVEKEVSPSHFQEVLRLKSIHGAFSEDFCRDLLSYANSHYEDGFQYMALRRFAFHMAVFPLISDLVFKALEASSSSDVKLPDLHEILDGIKTAKGKIENLILFSSDLQELTLEQVKAVLGFFSMEEDEMEEVASMLHEKILEALQGEEFREKGEVRLHKGREGAPYSCWIQKETQKGEGILLSFIEEDLGSGNDKKIKKLSQFFLPKDQSLPVIESEGVLARIYPEKLKEASSWVLAHKEVFKRIPNAASYFAPPYKRHMPHEGKLDRKFEWESPWYNGDLEKARETLSLPSSMWEEEEERIGYADLIHSFKRLVKGVELLEESGFSHRDLMSANIFLKKENNEWVAHIADFDHTLDLTSLDSLHEEEIEELNDRHNIMGNILHTFLPEYRSILIGDLELDSEKKEKIKQDFLRMKKERLEAYEIDPLLGDVELLKVANERSEDVIRDLAVSSLFFECFADLICRSQLAEKRRQGCMKEFLLQGDTPFDANRKAIEKAQFPEYHEIEQALDEAEQLGRSLNL